MALEISNRRLRIGFLSAAAIALGAAGSLSGTCGPFTDVAADAFCPFVLEVFTLGITTGTTPTTYDPSSSVSRLQMAAFLSRTVDRVLLKGSRRAGARKFWTPQGASVLGVTTVGQNPYGIEFDGADLWVSSEAFNTVTRVRASDGKALETWTGATNAVGVLLAMGRVLVAGNTAPGRLYALEPRLPAGSVTTVASSLGNGASGIAFDGGRVWTANQGGTVSIITPQASIPWTVTTTNITIGSSSPVGILFDGTNMWATDFAAGTVVKLDANGSVLQTVTVGGAPVWPVFDGTNIWVPNRGSSTVTVLRPATGAILQTLTGNGLSGAYGSAFDGERVLITNNTGNSVSLFKAADLSPLGTFGTGADQPGVACTDGTNFWITLSLGSTIVRF